MNPLSSQVRRLQDELKPILVGGSPTNQEISKMCMRIPPLLIMALDDEYHLFSKQLNELKQLITAHQAPTTVLKQARSQSKNSMGRMRRAVVPSTNVETRHLILSAKHYFMSDPRSNLPIARYWPLQFLLYITAFSKEVPRVREFLDLHMSIDEMRRCALNAKNATVGRWSLYEWGKRLQTALQLLDDERSLSGPRLENEFLCCNGKRIKLSQKQLLFVDLLLRNQGSTVTYEQFEKSTITNPSRIKVDLMKKLRRSSLNMNIVGADRSYRLI